MGQAVPGLAPSASHILQCYLGGPCILKLCSDMLSGHTAVYTAHTHAVKILLWEAATLPALQTFFK